MSLTQERIDFYKQRRQNRVDGKYNGIPIYLLFPKFGQFIPTFDKGDEIMLTANSGIGKSNLWVGFILYSIYKIKKLWPNLVFKPRLVIALLEDTKEKLLDMMFSLIMYDKHKIRVDRMTLLSNRETALDERYIAILEDVAKEIDQILSYTEIIDSVYNPTGLYKWARDITERHGKHHKVTKEFIHENSKENVDVYSHYTPNDPDEHWIFITDNLNNLSNEAGLSQLQTINKWTRDYCRLQICKHWKWTVINIMQQSADSEKQQFDFRGNSIIDKIKPSLDGLGNSKECQRDHFIILGLFAPDRYGIDMYNGYDIKNIFKDNFRSIIILKSNISVVNKEIPLYFDGGVSCIRELKKSNEISQREIESIKSNTYGV